MIKATSRSRPMPVTEINLGDAAHSDMNEGAQTDALCPEESAEIDAIRQEIRRVALIVSNRKQAQETARLQLRMRTFAQSVARSAVAQVDDRRSRTHAKSVIYRHLVPLLHTQIITAREVRAAYRKRLLGWFAACIAVGGAVAVLVRFPSLLM